MLLSSLVFKIDVLVSATFVHSLVDFLTLIFTVC